MKKPSSSCSPPPSLSTTQTTRQASLKRRHRWVAGAVIMGVAVMGGLSFASVPLYRIFCQKTGYGGTPQISLTPCTRQGSRVLTIRFNADVNRNLPWDFRPLQNEMTLRTGETGLAFYQVYNRTAHPMVGVAVYNVTPDKAAMYFNKIECFCFERQTIPPRAPMDMPVQFFIDPQITEDPYLDDVETITLSYTFFQVHDPALKEVYGLSLVK